VAHTCNPSYSAVQEDRGSKPAQANSSGDPISKNNPSQKRAGGVAQVVKRPSRRKKRKRRWSKREEERRRRRKIKNINIIC
jgi:hypothetical protein